MAKLRMAHASTHGARKPPEPKERLNDGNNNGQLRIANATSCGARKAAWAKINTSDKQLNMSDIFGIYQEVSSKNVSEFQALTNSGWLDCLTSKQVNFTYNRDGFIQEK